MKLDNLKHLFDAANDYIRAISFTRKFTRGAK